MFQQRGVLPLGTHRQGHAHHQAHHASINVNSHQPQHHAPRESASPAQHPTLPRHPGQLGPSPAALTGSNLTSTNTSSNPASLRGQRQQQAGIAGGAAHAGKMPMSVPTSHQQQVSQQAQMQNAIRNISQSSNGPVVSSTANGHHASGDQGGPAGQIINNMSGARGTIVEMIERLRGECDRYHQQAGTLKLEYDKSTAQNRELEAQQHSYYDIMIRLKTDVIHNQQIIQRLQAIIVQLLTHLPQDQQQQIATMVEKAKHLDPSDQGKLVQNAANQLQNDLLQHNLIKNNSQSAGQNGGGPAAALAQAMMGPQSQTLGAVQGAQQALNKLQSLQQHQQSVQNTQSQNGGPIDPMAAAQQALQQQQQQQQQQQAGLNPNLLNMLANGGQMNPASLPGLLQLLGGNNSQMNAATLLAQMNQANQAVQGGASSSSMAHTNPLMAAAAALNGGQALTSQPQTTKPTSKAITTHPLYLQSRGDSRSSVRSTELSPPLQNGGLPTIQTSQPSTSHAAPPKAKKAKNDPNLGNDDDEHSEQELVVDEENNQNAANQLAAAGQAASQAGNMTKFPTGLPNASIQSLGSQSTMNLLQLQQAAAAALGKPGMTNPAAAALQQHLAAMTGANPNSVPDYSALLGQQSAVSNSSGKGQGFSLRLGRDGQVLERLQFSPQSKHLVYGQAGKQSLPKTCTLVKQFNHNEVVCAVTINPKTQHVYTGARGVVKIWDSGEDMSDAPTTHAADAHLPNSRSSSRNGAQSSTSRPQSRNSTSPTSAAAASQELFRIDGLYEETYIRSCKIFDQGTRLIIGGEASILTMWDLGGLSGGAASPVKMAELTSDAPACYALCVPEEMDSKICYACCSDGFVSIWDLRTNKVVNRFQAHNDGASCVDFKSNQLWTGGLDNTVKCWDTRNFPSAAAKPGTPVQFFALPSQVFSLSCNQKSGWVACGLEDSTVELLNTNLADTGADRTDRYKLHYHDSCVLSLKYANSGQYLVSTGKDNLLNAWNSPEGQLLMSERDNASILCCDISYDDRYVVTGCGDKKASLYKFS